MHGAEARLTSLGALAPRPIPHTRLGENIDFGAPVRRGPTRTTFGGSNPPNNSNPLCQWLAIVLKRRVLVASSLGRAAIFQLSRPAEEALHAQHQMVRPHPAAPHHGPPP